MKEFLKPSYLDDALSTNRMGGGNIQIINIIQVFIGVMTIRSLRLFAFGKY